MVLQETVKKQIQELLHKIKAGLGGTPGRVRHNIFTCSMVLIFFYYTSAVLLLVLLQTGSPNPRQSNTARSSSVSMHWNILMTNWLIQFLHWWSHRVSSLQSVRHFPKISITFSLIWIYVKQRQISSICTWVPSMSKTLLQSPKQRTRKLSWTPTSLKPSVSFTVYKTNNYGIYHWRFSFRAASSFPWCIPCVVNQFMLWGIYLTQV